MGSEMCIRDSSVTMQLNYFPADHGISSHYSPWQLMNNPQLDYNKHFVACFGDYVQASNENVPTNDMRALTIDCIYLYPNAFEPQGGLTLMSVETGAIVTRPRVWKIPVTDVVIKAVNKLGAAQGFSNKKISGKANQVTVSYTHLTLPTICSV